MSRIPIVLVVLVVGVVGVIAGLRAVTPSAEVAKVAEVASRSASAGTSSAEARDATSVPLALVDGRLLVPVTVEGLGRQLFLLDTAAGASVISARLRARLDPGAADVRADSVRGASGVTVMERVRLPRMRVGPASSDSVWAVVADIGDFREYDGRAVEGILGVDALAGHDLEIDIPGGALRLLPGGAAPRRPAGDDGVPFTSRIQAGFVEFDAAVNGRPVRAVLDTGARQSVLNWRAAALAGLTPGSEGVREREEGSRGIDGGARVSSHLAVVDGLAIGARRLPAAEVKIADLGIFDAVGLGDRAAMLVGVDVLRECPIRIAYSTGRLRVCPEGPAGR